jgi:glucose-1-phosphatase
MERKMKTGRLIALILATALCVSLVFNVRGGGSAAKPAAESAAEVKDASSAAESAVPTEAAAEPTAEPETAKEPVIGEVIDPGDAYTLKEMVVLSRHNIRAPLSSGGSASVDMTPHTWIKWTGQSSELTLKGGVLETMMGQYFRKWLEAEELIPLNYRPEGGEVRVYANAKQRTIATARYFLTGMLPAAGTEVDWRVEFGEMDPMFKPQFTFMTDAYREAVQKEMNECFDAYRDQLAESYKFLEDVIDYKESPGYKSGDYGELVTDDLTLKIEAGDEPKMSGTLKNANTVIDALILQYYEENDDRKAGFGRVLTEEEWEKLETVKEAYNDILFTGELTSVNLAHPLLGEISDELANEERKFSFLCGHDANIASVLAALDVKEYELPGVLEKTTPIGTKLVFGKWADESGEEFVSVHLVYQSLDELRMRTELSTDVPPMAYPVEFEEISANADGLYTIGDLQALFAEKIKEYDDLQAEYADTAEIKNAA